MSDNFSMTIEEKESLAEELKKDIANETEAKRNNNYSNYENDEFTLEEKQEMLDVLLKDIAVEYPNSKVLRNITAGDNDIKKSNDEYSHDYVIAAYLESIDKKIDTIKKCVIFFTVLTVISLAFYLLFICQITR